MEETGPELGFEAQVRLRGAGKGEIPGRTVYVTAASLPFLQLSRFVPDIGPHCLLCLSVLSACPLTCSAHSSPLSHFSDVTCPGDYPDQCT